MEAVVILGKCPKSNQLYGMRTQKMSDGDWWRTWVFPIDEARAKHEGYDQTQVMGHLYHTEEYRGCPYCGVKYFLQCSKCRKLSCYNGEKKATCPWCGNKMDNLSWSSEPVVFTVTGGDI